MFFAFKCPLQFILTNFKIIKMATFNVINSNDSGQGSLRDAINFANESPGRDDVFVQTDVELNSAIEITESVNIGTPFGATITQTNKDRIFYIQDGEPKTKADVSLYRLNLTGGHGFIGGAIISYEHLTITDSSLYNNSAVASGAAVYVANSNLIVERTKVYDNKITSEPDVSDRDFSVLDGELKLVSFSSEFNEVTEIIAEESEPDEIEITAIAEIPESTEDFLVSGAESDTSAASFVNNTILNPDLDPEDFNVFEGSSEADKMIGGSDRDLIRGNGGNDTLKGSSGKDSISGDQGKDILYGGRGADTLMGGAGADTLYGAAGNDIIHGDAGDDVLIGGGGKNFLLGGSGSDVFNFSVEGKNVIADFELGIDRLQLLEISSSDLDITGEVNSIISYQGHQIGTLLAVNPARLSLHSFIEA